MFGLNPNTVVTRFCYTVTLDAVQTLKPLSLLSEIVAFYLSREQVNTRSTLQAIDSEPIRPYSVLLLHTRKKIWSRITARYKWWSKWLRVTTTMRKVIALSTKLSSIHLFSIFRGRVTGPQLEQRTQDLPLPSCPAFPGNHETLPGQTGDISWQNRSGKPASKAPSFYIQPLPPAVPRNVGMQIK